MNTEVAVTNKPARQSIEDISSMLLPMNGYNLLVPGVVVAEIVTFVTPEEEHDEDAPPWFLGTIYWRNQRVPLVSYEALTGGPCPLMSPYCRIAVVNKTGLSQQLDFFALLLQSTPRLLRLTAEDITPDDEKPVDTGQKLHVRVSGEEAIVPDIQYIERAVINYLEMV